MPKTITQTGTHYGRNKTVAELKAAAPDRKLRDTIIKAYQDGRRGFMRVGQLLEDKRQELGGTSRGGTPVKSKFWAWFEEQDFPFSRNTAENYLLFAREPQRYELHCEQVRKRSAKYRIDSRKGHAAPTGSRRVGLADDLYDALSECAHRRHHAIDLEVENAVVAHLEVHAPDLLDKVRKHAKR